MLDAPYRIIRCPYCGKTNVYNPFSCLSDVQCKTCGTRMSPSRIRRYAAAWRHMQKLTRASLTMSIVSVVLIVVCVVGVLLTRRPERTEADKHGPPTAVYVYVTAEWGLYHREDCQHISTKRRSRLLLEAALKYKLRPCKECRPPSDAPQRMEM